MSAVGGRNAGRELTDARVAYAARSDPAGQSRACMLQAGCAITTFGLVDNSPHAGRPSQDRLIMAFAPARSTRPTPWAGRLASAARTAWTRDRVRRGRGRR